jgi:hypothetical protein
VAKDDMPSLNSAKIWLLAHRVRTH